MASVRRTLSLPRPGAPMNGEACQVSSPSSKPPSNSQNYPPHGNVLSSSFGSLDYALYKAQSFIISLLSQRSSRPFDRSKLKGHIWRRAFLHFFMCFLVGVFVGFTPFVPMNFSTTVMPKHPPFNFEGLLPTNADFYSGQKNERMVVERFLLNDSLSSVPQEGDIEINDGAVEHTVLSDSLDTASDIVLNKLLIIVTPTHAWPLQGYYLQRLAHTLKLVPHPLLWIVVEMNSQTAETAEILRKTGLVYRHLVCSIKNSTEIADRIVLLRNVALSHIETHRLDGIVYFADEDKIYTTDLFDQMRNISRLGTWTVAKLVESEGIILYEGPICNGSQVIGWHVPGMAKRYRRFHAALSGFAFNSTIIWDPKRWHRPTIEPIRQLQTVKHDMKVSTLIKQIVEDESQMECFAMNSPGIMVWHHTIDPGSHPRDWFSGNSFGTIVPIE